MAEPRVVKVGFKQTLLVPSSTPMDRGWPREDPGTPKLGCPTCPQACSTTGKHDGNSMNMKRMRGRNHRSGGGGGGGGSGGAIRHHSGGGTPLNRNHVFDSNGPEIRIRGTAQQLFEKYLQLGRDATSSGDRVTAEAFFQHAEHYFRILNAMNQAQQQGGQPNGQGQQQQHPQGNQQRRNYQQGDGYQGNDDGQGQGDSDDGDQRSERAMPRAWAISRTHGKSRSPLHRRKADPPASKSCVPCGISARTGRPCRSSAGATSRRSASAV